MIVGSRRPLGGGGRVVAHVTMSDVMSTEQALEAWGAYDRDNPFPLFADVRELGAVHPVTLADGHGLARGRVRGGASGAERSAPVEGHAGRARDGRRRRGRGPAGTVVRAAHARSSIRRTTPGCAASSPPRSRSAASRSSGRGSQAIIDDLLDGDRRGRTRYPHRSRRVVRVSAAVHGDLRAARRARSRSADARARTYGAARSDLERRTSTRGRRRRSDASSRCSARSSRRSNATPGDDLVQRADHRSRRRRAARPARAALDDLPADRRRARHDRQPHRQQRRRAASTSRAARCAARRPEPDPGGGRGAPPLRRARSALDVPLRGRADRDRRRDDPGRRAGHHLLGGREPGRDANTPTPKRSTSIAPECATSRSATASTSASARRSPAWKASSRSASLLARFPSSASRFRVDELHWGHGDGLVLRGLSELPVIPGRARPRQ